MNRLAIEAVRGTAYKVMKVHPEFTYDDANPIVGVWADCLSSTLGIPGYTLGVGSICLCRDRIQVSPITRNPDPDMVSKVMNAAAKAAPIPWKNHEHPQLGPVEIGGFDYLRTIRIHKNGSFSRNVRMDSWWHRRYASHCPRHS